jgi:hypothetical protein
MTKNILKEKSAISMLIVAIVIIVVVAGAAGAGYYLTTQAPGASPTPTAGPTVTPTATSSPSTTATPAVSTTPETSHSPETSTSPSTSPSSASDVSDASSLRYSVSATEGGKTEGYTYQVKKTDSALMLRIDYTDENGEASTYIVNGVQRKAWIKTDGQWEDISTQYDIWYNTWNNLHDAYLNNLAGWTSGEWTYTESGVTVRLYDITVNPSLPDSLFQP